MMFYISIIDSYKFINRNSSGTSIFDFWTILNSFYVGSGKGF